MKQGPQEARFWILVVTQRPKVMPEIMLLQEAPGAMCVVSWPGILADGGMPRSPNIPALGLVRRGAQAGMPVTGGVLGADRRAWSLAERISTNVSSDNRRCGISKAAFSGSTTARATMRTSR